MNAGEDEIQRRVVYTVVVAVLNGGAVGMRFWKGNEAMRRFFDISARLGIC